MRQKVLSRFSLAAAALSAILLVGATSAHAYVRIGTEIAGCYPIMTASGTEYVHTFAIIAGASEFPTDQSISDLVEMQRVECTLSDRSHVWDDKWYTAHVGQGSMLILGWRNMTTGRQDWARVLNTESAWYVRSKYNVQEETLFEGTMKKYTSTPGGSSRLDFDIRNPINTSVASFNDIDYSFGF